MNHKKFLRASSSAVIIVIVVTLLLASSAVAQSKYKTPNKLEGSADPLLDPGRNFSGTEVGELSPAETLAPAQTIKHVIIVIQENRSTDNVFGSDLYNQPRLLPKAHLVSSGACGGTQQIQLTGVPLNDFCFDPNHGHTQGWAPMWNNGQMDGACNVPIDHKKCTTIPNANYSYINYADVVPYFNIAQNYGYANWMFQTNQGESFTAHQFLFAGTSAPIQSPQTYFDWFAAGSTTLNGKSGVATGCASSPANAVVVEIDPQGSESPGYTPPGETPGFPCYDHPTLASVLDTAGLSWIYYADTYTNNLWTAPGVIQDICDPVANGQCTGADWAKVIPATTTDGAPVLTALGANPHSDPNVKPCSLPAVSWVIPDGWNSDHPGKTNPAFVIDGGPSWVAAIVNAVGGVDNSDNPLPHHCTDNGVPYWQDTVILITWDDWGGFFDDARPPGCPPPGPLCSGYSNGTGGSYVYGFRVPLLVVSPYAKPAYVSGPVNNPNCVGTHHCHDFGSILNFIEHTFGLPSINGSVYPYADSLVMDAGAGHYSLYDFFGTEFHNFTWIQGAKYPSTCFFNPKGCKVPNWPSDPDNDATNPQD